MRKSLFIWLLLPVVFLASCSLIYDQPGENTCPELSIAIAFPENFVPETRSTVGTVPAEADENAIKDLAIWVFRSSENHEKVGSILVDKENELPAAGGIRKYALIVDQAFMLERPQVDVFVLVNRASIGSQLTEDSSWEEVNNACFGGDLYFSPKVPITTVPKKDGKSLGLPMSGVGKGLKVGGEEPFLKVPTISLGRAVSKLRFVFSQMYTENSPENSTEIEEFAIERVVLNGSQIPVDEYVFSTGAYNIKPDNYVSDKLEITWPEGMDLESSDAPEIYSYAGQDGPSYEQLIKDGITSKHLSHLGTYYLRESDKALSGTVYYSVKKEGVTQDKELDFHMAAPGDFARNHTWTVYGYFISNRTLQLAVSVLPWDKSDYDIAFSTSSLMVTHKLAVLDNSVQSIERIGTSDCYDVTLKRNSPASAYLNVVTPMGGKLQLIVEGDQDAFDVWFTDENNRNARETTIDPYYQNGRINISIDRKQSYSGVATGKSIELKFTATTPDGEREIGGESECIDQKFKFILP